MWVRFTRLGTEEWDVEIATVNPPNTQNTIFANRTENNVGIQKIPKKCNFMSPKTT